MQQYYLIRPFLEDAYKACGGFVLACPAGHLESALGGAEVVNNFSPITEINLESYQLMAAYLPTFEEWKELPERQSIKEFILREYKTVLTDREEPDEADEPEYSEYDHGWQDSRLQLLTLLYCDYVEENTELPPNLEAFKKVFPEV